MNTWSPTKRTTTCSECLPAGSHRPHKVKSLSHWRHLYTNPVISALQIEQSKSWWALPKQLPVDAGADVVLTSWMKILIGLSCSSKWPLDITLRAAKVSLMLSHGMAILSFSSSTTKETHNYYEHTTQSVDSLIIKDRKGKHKWSHISYRRIRFLLFHQPGEDRRSRLSGREKCG